MKRKANLFRPSTRVLAAVFSSLLIAAVWLVGRSEIQQRRDRALIIALQRDDTAKVLAALNAGADVNARYVPNNIRLFSREWVQVMLGTRQRESAPSALLVVMGWPTGDVFCSPPCIRDIPEKRLFVMKALLDRGADANAGDDRCGQTPLHRAAEFGNIKDMLLLLKYGARIDQRDELGQTPVFRAVRCSDNGDALGLLLDRGANIRIRDSGGNAIMHFVADTEYERRAELLLKGGADLHVRNSSGYTPLDMARSSGNRRMLSLLQGWEARHPEHP